MMAKQLQVEVFGGQVKASKAVTASHIHLFNNWLLLTLSNS